MFSTFPCCLFLATHSAQVVGFVKGIVGDLVSEFVCYCFGLIAEAALLVSEFELQKVIRLDFKQHLKCAEN